MEVATRSERAPSYPALCCWDGGGTKRTVTGAWKRQRRGKEKRRRSPANRQTVVWQLRSVESQLNGPA